MKSWQRIVGLAVALSFFVAFAVAQEAKRESQLRSVHGIVSAAIPS